MAIVVAAAASTFVAPPSAAKHAPVKPSSKSNAVIPGQTHWTAVLGPSSTSQILVVVDFLETSRSTDVAIEIRPISKPDAATNEPDAPFISQIASPAGLCSATSIIHGQSTIIALLISTAEQQCYHRSLHTLASVPRECFIKLLAREALYLPAI